MSKHDANMLPFNYLRLTMTGEKGRWRTRAVTVGEDSGGPSQSRADRENGSGGMHTARQSETQGD
jgi:hypothetical protein